MKEYILLQQVATIDEYREYIEKKIIPLVVFSNNEQTFHNNLYIDNNFESTNGKFHTINGDKLLDSIEKNEIVINKLYTKLGKIKYIDRIFHSGKNYDSGIIYKNSVLKNIAYKLTSSEVVSSLLFQDDESICFSMESNSLCDEMIKNYDRKISDEKKLIKK